MFKFLKATRKKIENNIKRFIIKTVLDNILQYDEIKCALCIQSAGAPDFCKLKFKVKSCGLGRCRF